MTRYGRNGAPRLTEKQKLIARKLNKIQQDIKKLWEAEARYKDKDFFKGLIECLVRQQIIVQKEFEEAGK